MTSKSKRYCSVPQCNNYKSDSISIHFFPKDPKLSKKWAIALKIGKPVSKCMTVCSDHFLQSDFHPVSYSTKRFLKAGVVPSQKIPVRSYDQPGPSSSARVFRIRRRDEYRQYEAETMEFEETVNIEQLTEEKNIPPPIADNPIHEAPAAKIKTFEDKCIQTGQLLRKQNIHFHEHLLASSARIKVYMGVNNKIFNTVLEIIKIALKAFPEINCMNIKKKLCLILTKLKLDLSFRALAIMFEISATSAQNYFHTYIQVLFYGLKPAIYFPSKEENLSNLPSAFKDYQKVRIVIDATEVAIQRTACLDCRIRTYSHYKKGHTSKFLISVAPSGLIAHVSAAYGGHVSDKAIFNEEKIIDLLDPYFDAIMVDKGVLIEKECSERGIGLIRPPFLRKKLQFSKEEALKTASIARARVHVERSIQRIKTFKIFSNKLQWSLVPYLTEMMFVVCALVNLSKPILQDDKFEK